jgi:hypothetical protein
MPDWNSWQVELIGINRACEERSIGYCLEHARTAACEYAFGQVNFASYQEITKDMLER